MRALILGAAAGGGSPQWNCNCAVCAAVRVGAPGTTPRSQSSIAIRGETGPWFLVNASPDLRQQLETLPTARDALRTTPVRAVILTDAEIDHTAGLLLVRESHHRVDVFAAPAVRAAITTAFPVMAVVDRYCGVDWSPLEPGVAVSLPDSSLELVPFVTGGDAPLYLGDGGAVPEAFGLAIRDRDDGSTLTYAPALARLDDTILGHLRDRDCVLLDGTFWEDDELPALGISTRAARDMGHLPLAGEGGTLEAFAGLAGRRILVHVNNTNPILIAGSAEQLAVAAAGIEVGFDGMEIVLR
jgi:pyrroloquinoline quinone biosynthesis protein B